MPTIEEHLARYSLPIHRGNVTAQNYVRDVTRLLAERDVWSGRACREEQEDGNGPCGGCRYCLPTIVKELQAENARLRRAAK